MYHLIFREEDEQVRQLVSAMHKVVELFPGSQEETKQALKSRLNRIAIQSQRQASGWV